MATLPNVCKMPGPPAPFVPTPLPNVGKSGDSPQRYSKKVKVEGHTVAIRGASFGSIGDAASKGTGGGLVSVNTHGPIKFIGPGSPDVKIEGKSVHYLGDPVINNCGPSGSPSNSATLAGVLHPALISKATKADVLAEVQELCDAHCEGKTEGDESQQYIHSKMWKKDADSGFTRQLRTEVPFDMSKTPPSAIMSKNAAKEGLTRQTTNWFHLGSRRPDAIVLNDYTKPWSGENIKAVIECKWGDDQYRAGQEAAYKKIAGSKNRLIELNSDNCDCK